MDWGRSSFASPGLFQTYVGDPKPMEKEGDDDDEISKRRHAVVGPEALVESLHLLRNLF
jgi:hypothetical protein